MPNPTRRTFLKTAIASAATFTVPGASPTFGFARAEETDPSRFAVAANALPFRGMWWFYPSFLEHPEGPFGQCKDPSESPLKSWKACLSWLADHGVNAAFVHFGPFGGDRSPFAGDRVRTGWGFHYLLDFERFPEARTFDRATLARNRELLNAICAHGKAVGCRVFTHHYNFSAPKPFVDQHRDELLKVPVGSKREVKTLYPGFCDQRLVLHRNLCWNSPLYREFMVACWEETCREIPDLAGILVTPGENARCPCVRCVGPTDDPSAPFLTSPERLATLGNFAKVFADTMTRTGRQPMIRAWAAGKSRPWIEVFPKGVPYVLKYSFFDVVDSPPDPAIAEWVAAGHIVIANPEIQGGENGGPTLWRRPGYLAEVARRTAEAGARGILACVNSEHGFLATPLRVQHSPTVLYAHAVATAGAPDRDISVALDRATFGESGEAIHDGLAACAEVTFLLPRIVFEPDEGYTWQFAYHFFAESWPGRIGDTIDAEPWIARDLASLKTLLDAARKGPYVEVFAATDLGGKLDPVGALAAAVERARAGERQVLDAASSVPDDAAEDYRLARQSARLSVLLGEEWIALLRARVTFEAALGGANPAARRVAIGERCLAEFDRAIAALEATIAVARELDPRLVGNALLERVPRKVAERREERAEAAKRLASV